LGRTLDQNVWGTQVHGDEAMKLITVDDVMEQLARIFTDGIYEKEQSLNF
jgi:heptosyltransferase I